MGELEDGKDVEYTQALAPEATLCLRRRFMDSNDWDERSSFGLWFIPVLFKGFVHSKQCSIALYTWLPVCSAII